MAGGGKSARVAADAPRVRLDRERILAAAEAIVAAEGVGRLTMRRIGAELGVNNTAIYRHFRDKEELLTKLADRLFGTLPELDPTLSWRERLRRDLRHALARYRCHPDLAQLLAVQPDTTPSLQIIAERALALLAEAGLTPAQAARMLQVLENHVVGTGLYYSHVEHAEDPRLHDAEAMRRVYTMLPANQYPYVVQAALHLLPDLDESFDLATDLILDGIERLAAENAQNGGAPAARRDEHPPDRSKERSQRDS